MKRFVSTAVRDALLGFALGALTVLIFRLLERPLSSGVAPFKNEALGALCSVPHVWLLAVVTVAGLTMFWASWIASFFARLARSWCAGVITGTFLVWFLVSLVVFLEWDQLRGRDFLLLSALGLLPIASSLVMAKRRLTRMVDYSVCVPAPVSITDDALFNRQVEFDLPVDDWAEDRLNRGRLIQSVAALIFRDKAPVIAIVGPLGEGKTSALNLLGVSLSSRKDLSIVVEFSSWLPGGEESLVFSLFGTIAEQVRARYVIPGLSTELRRFARLLAGAVPKVGEMLRNFFQEPSQVEQLVALNRFLSELPVRIVVLVDELDRMDPKELHMLLKAIRGVADLPNVTYVCAYDKKSLVRLISESDPAYGQLYLEKFFPMQLTLPRIDQDLLGRFFDRELEAVAKALNLFPGEKDKKAFDESLLPLWHTCIKRYLRNFRRMTLFFNAFHSSLKNVSAEVNPFDMMILQLVKTMSDVTYEFIYENGPLFYDPGLRIALWMERLSVDDKKEAAIRDQRLNEFFNSLDPSIKRWVTDLLAAIFPTVSHCLRGDRSSWIGRNADRAEEEHRIYHPDYFPRYFIDQVPSGMFGVAEMAGFIERMNALGTAAQCTALFRETLGDLRANPWKRWDFLRSLVTATGHLGGLQCEGVINGVVEASSSLDYDFFGISEWGRARALLLAAANQFSGAPRLQEVLANAIRRAASDGFAADVLDYCTSRRTKNKIITDWRYVDEATLKAAFDERMSSKYPVGSQQEFRYGREDVSPFHAWVGLGVEAQGKEADFFRDRFRRFPVEQGRFLGWALPRQALYEGDPLMTVERLFPVDEIFESAQLQPADFWPETDRGSVEWFLELVRERRAGQQNGG